MENLRRPSTMGANSGHLDTRRRLLERGWSGAGLGLSSSGPTPVVIEQIAELLEQGSDQSLPYSRPVYSEMDQLFFDLLTYAPGMNTTWADEQAVIEAEAVADPRARPGKIDDRARRLLDGARAKGWRKVSFAGGTDQPAIAITFDGAGRYAYEHTLPIGLK